MDAESSMSPQACSGECPSCSQEPPEGSDAGRRPLSGWSMAGASLLFFVVPLVTGATAAASLRGSGPALQWAAGIGGLLAGMALSALVARRLGRP